MKTFITLVYYAKDGEEDSVVPVAEAGDDHEEFSYVLEMEGPVAPSVGDTVDYRGVYPTQAPWGFYCITQRVLAVDEHSAEWRCVADLVRLIELPGGSTPLPSLMYRSKS